MTTPGRLAVVVGLTIAAVGLLVVLVLQPWWRGAAPAGLQLPVGLLSLALGIGVSVWLQQRPKPTRLRSRRRGRLRDRVQRSESEESEESE